MTSACVHEPAIVVAGLFEREAAARDGEIGLESWEVGGKVFAGCAHNDGVVSAELAA